MSDRLVCDSHLKEFIKQKARVLRPGWPVKYVSQDALDKIEARTRAFVIETIKHHPTKGQAFKQVY